MIGTKTMIDGAGNVTTLGAIVLNAIQTDPLNQVLTVILSVLSITYMVIQIYTAIPKVKRMLRRKRNGN